MMDYKESRVNLMVSNMDEAMDFYVNKLGLEFLNRYGDHYAEVRAANLIIGIHPANEGVNWGDNVSVGLGVSNFDECIAELESLGIKLRVTQDGWVRLAHFSDDDGDQLYLAENANLS